MLRSEYANTPTAELAARLDRSASAVYQEAIRLGLRKSSGYLSSPYAGRRLSGNHKGLVHRFRPGHATWNKGRKGWDAGGRSHETRFRPRRVDLVDLRELKGRARANYKPVGAEVRDKHGYWKRKIRDDARPGHAKDNWAYVHVLMWEEAHGPVPGGHCVIFINSDRDDLRLENLTLVSRRELAWLNKRGFNALPPELRPTGIASARLQVARRIHEEQSA